MPVPPTYNRIFDWFHVVEAFRDRLRILCTHIDEHKMYVGVEDDVADMKRALQLCAYALGEEETPEEELYYRTFPIPEVRDWLEYSKQPISDMHRQMRDNAWDSESKYWNELWDLVKTSGRRWWC